MQISKRFRYILLDEAGNLDFSPSGTKYFQLAAMTKERPFFAGKELSELKYDLLEEGTALERFHASEDRQKVRNQVFEIIARHLDGVRVDSLIVEKSKTMPSVRETARFYPEMLGYLLRFILEQHDLSQFAEVLVFTDRLPIGKQRKAVEKSVKMTLANMLPSGARYRVYHHDSKSNFDLQIADYFNWAIYRKWDRGDARSYDLVRSVISSEFDIFRTGTKHYY